ncbi:hypothetical protein RCS94_01330 [Orbaceae bacterium ac157xtp]
MKNKMLTFILSTFFIVGVLLLGSALVTYLNSHSLKNIGAILVLSIMGGAFFLVGAVPLFILYKKNAVKKDLLKNGRPVPAKVKSVYYNEALQVNGRSPFVIECHWVDPSNPSSLHIFKSHNIWFDPSDFIRSENITVYIDQNNPKRYYVDLSFLPTVR